MAINPASRAATKVSTWATRLTAISPATLNSITSPSTPTTRTTLARANRIAARALASTDTFAVITPPSDRASATAEPPPFS